MDNDDYVYGTIESCDLIEVQRFKKNDRLKLFWNKKGIKAIIGLRGKLEDHPELVKQIKDHKESKGSG